MGLFSKKEAEPCPICGKPLKWTNSVDLADAKVCFDCADGAAKKVNNDNYIEFTLQQVKDILDGKDVSEVKVRSRDDAGACAICGAELKKRNTVLLKDGYICDDCAKLLRGEFFKEELWANDKANAEKLKKYRDDIIEKGRFRDFSGSKQVNSVTVTVDALREVELDFVKERLQSEKDSQKEYLDKYGEEYDNIFAVTESFDYQLGGMAGGPIRAKKMKGKMVVKGCVEKGSFINGDQVVLIDDSGEEEVAILETIPCGGKNLEGQLTEKVGKERVESHSYA